MSVEEFQRWVIIDQLDPFGEDRADLRIAVLDSLICNALGGHTRPKDFMFHFGRTDEEREAELREGIEMFTSYYGGEEGDPGKLLVAPEWGE